MRRPLPCVPAQAVVHWRLEVKTPEFQETRQACSSPWIKGETGKGTQSGLNCSSVEKDLFPTLHTVIWNWTPQAWGNMLRMNGCVLWLSPGVHRVKSSGRRALGLLQRTRLCTLQARAIAGEADETLTDAPSRRMNLKVTSSKAQYKKMLLFGQRDYKKTPLPPRARTWFSWKSLSWVPALSPLNGVSFRVCNTQTAWWDPKAPLGWEFPWRQ